MTDRRTAAGPWRRSLAATRALVMTAIDRVGRWRLGLDAEFPEYDAYRRRPARIRIAVLTALAAAAAAVVAVALADGLAHGEASTEPVTPAPSSGGAPAPAPTSSAPSAPTSSAPSAATLSAYHRSSMATHGSATGLASSPRSLHTWRADLTTPSNSAGETDVASELIAAFARTAIPAAQQVDTRHTSAIPSTAIAAAA